jgi:preprotein translocase subunit SecD
MNQFPLWKNVLIALVLAISGLYALPNLFGESPAIQISPEYTSGLKIDEALQKRISDALKQAGVAEPSSMDASPASLMLRFADTDSQFKAYSALKETLVGYNAAQNLVPDTPAWLRALGAAPMYLGLDLRGGIHFLMEVDMKSAVQQDEEQIVEDFRSLMREQKIRYKAVRRLSEGGVEVAFSDAASRDQARGKLEQSNPSLMAKTADEGEDFKLLFHYTEPALRETKTRALEQNITTLRNRVNELGVAEPVILQQGSDRIAVQLPGVQDSTKARKILKSTATLEFRLTEGENATLWEEAKRTGKIPPNARLYFQNDPGRSPVLLKRAVIATGDHINHAASTVDPQDGQPAVSVRLDSVGGKKMYDTTKENVGKPMAVVFIEYDAETGKKQEKVVSIATIREAFGKNFQVTGLEREEAQNLALLLRAGALKAPIKIIEERTVGPSLGKENITKGYFAFGVGFILVIIFMAWRYSMFGIVADGVLLLNVVLIVAALSLIQATLTLPGIAGILLTVGMAVDANVLIFERIREELRNGMSVQAAIHAGYERAWGTIADSNITTLIAAITLFSFGTGPVKGFAITLCIGILTSMFTAVMVSRSIVNFLFGGKKIAKLPV